MSSYFIFILMSLFFAVVIYPLAVRPYLRKKKGQLSVDDEIPYTIIPLIALLFLLLVTDAIRYYLGTGVSLEDFCSMFEMTFVMTAMAAYLVIILPNVFHLKYAGVQFTKPIVGNRAIFIIIITLASTLDFATNLAEVFWMELLS